MNDVAPQPRWPSRVVSGLRQLAHPVVTWLHRHETLLWWLHSTWALAVGVGVMWLGSRNYAWLRVTYGYIAFIWVASFALPRLLRSPRLDPKWHRPLLLATNYFVKNFYQQLLFFVLPVYWASSTFGSRNFVFVILVGVSALLSTMDVVYDRHVSVKRVLTGAFFGFNLFVCVNVVLPQLWHISNAAALRLSVGLAIVGMVTLAVETPRLRNRAVAAGIVLSSALLVLLIEIGRPWIPPAPLRVVRTDFGDQFQRSPPTVTHRFERLPETGAAGTRIYAVTAISAPLGLRDRVRHVWSVNGQQVQVSAPYEVTGGRSEGYRLWTSLTLKPGVATDSIRLDVETEAGQLIGRARLAKAN